MLKAIANAIDNIRKEHGAPALARDQRLDDLARRQAASIASQGDLSHEDSAGRDLAARFNDAGIRYRQIGENLALVSGHEDVVDRAVRGWLGSAAHRTNLLNPAFEQTGLGTARGDSARYIVQIFLEPRHDAAWFSEPRPSIAALTSAIPLLGSITVSHADRSRFFPEARP
jgi:uncharacterized protein YkwD